MKMIIATTEAAESQPSKQKGNQNRIGIFTAIFLIQYFLLTWYSSVFQIIAWNWKHLIKRKVQAKKVFWHVVLHSYLCNALCNFLSKLKAANGFQKHILKSKARDQLIQARKKLFYHVMVKNVLSTFLIRIESTWRHEMKEQKLELTLLYCGRTVKSSSSSILGNGTSWGNQKDNSKHFLL